MKRIVPVLLVALSMVAVAGVAGTEPLYKQWLFNGQPLPGESLLERADVETRAREAIGRTQLSLTEMSVDARRLANRK